MLLLINKHAKVSPTGCLTLIVRQEYHHSLTAFIPHYFVCGIQPGGFLAHPEMLWQTYFDFHSRLYLLFRLWWTAFALIRSQPV